MNIDTNKMTPAEYAAHTGAMSYPAGLAKKAKEAEEIAACQASDADCVGLFISNLEKPDSRLVTERPGEWIGYGEKEKAAILNALKEWRASKEKA